MNDLLNSPNVNSHDPERADALAHYFELRDKLVSLKAAPDPNLAAIDAAVHELEQAQLAYKATYGLYGNNPIDDFELQTQPGPNGQPKQALPG